MSKSVERLTEEVIGVKAAPIEVFALDVVSQRRVAQLERDVAELTRLLLQQHSSSSSV